MTEINGQIEQVSLQDAEEVQESAAYISLKEQRQVINDCAFIQSEIADCYASIGYELAEFMAQKGVEFSLNWQNKEVPQLFLDFLDSCDSVKKLPSSYVYSPIVELGEPAEGPAMEFHASAAWQYIAELEKKKHDI